MIFTLVGGVGSLLFLILFVYSTYILSTSVHPGVQVAPITSSQEQELELGVIPEGNENDSESSVLTQHSTGRIANNNNNHNTNLSVEQHPYSLSRISLQNSESTVTGVTGTTDAAPVNAPVINSVSRSALVPLVDIQIQWRNYYARVQKLRQPLLFIWYL